MIVMVGECTGRRVPRLQELGWGRMWIARGRNIYTYEGEPWGFDNGAFRDWVREEPFNEAAYLRSIKSAEASGSIPYLAVLPDVPAGGTDSLKFSMEWLEKLPQPWPWYIAVQDGMTPADLTDLDRIHGLFLGGTNTFKATAGEWCDWAHAHGLRFHYGRAGTQEKVRHAMEVGADSLDSAFPMWNEERWGLFERWVSQGPCQGWLFEEAERPV